MKKILIGSTGFVGHNLRRALEFDALIHRPNVDTLRDASADLVVCAGLPAAKWVANQDPATDLANVEALSGVLDTMDVDRFVLISTIDVYQPPVFVDETVRPPHDGAEPYGRHRAWFERFVMERFESFMIVRLPALFGPGLRKNLVFDLLEGRDDQYSKVNSVSMFQFWDITATWPLVDHAAGLGIDVLNVATEPVAARDAAKLFDVELTRVGPVIQYNVHTRYASDLAGRNGPYILSAEDQLAGIGRLRDSWSRK